jgi:hypothetical protein
MSEARSRASVFITLAAAIVVGGLVAACSGGGSTSGIGDASAAATAPGAPSVAPVPSATPAIAAADRLAAMIPPAIGDVTLTTSTPDPAAYIKVSVGRRLGPVLAAVGKSAADVAVASANGATEAGSLFIDAVQIDGVDPATLLPAFQAAATAPPTTGATTATVGGRDVVTWSQASGTTAVYAHDDVLFYVSSPIVEWVDAAVAALP